MRRTIPPRRGNMLCQEMLMKWNHLMLKLMPLSQVKRGKKEEGLGFWGNLLLVRKA